MTQVLLGVGGHKDPVGDKGGKQEEELLHSHVMKNQQ